VIRSAAIVPFLVALAFAPAAASGTSAICAPSDTPVYDDTISGIASPCATNPGTIVVESTYIQNASSTGGTALATYPVLTVRTGLAHDLAFVFDPPSEVAESGLRGAGIYTPTRLGYGLSYTALQTDRSALAIFTSVLPPVSRFSPNLVQSKYALGLTSDYALGQKFTVGLAGEESSSATRGFDRIVPSGALSASYAAAADTAISTDVGTRVWGRKGIVQQYSDVGVDESLSKHVVFKVGLGTTFNPAANSKPHYLASGVDYRI
jgi:hypothetical protein